MRMYEVMEIAVVLKNFVVISVLTSRIRKLMIRQELFQHIIKVTLT